MRSFQNRVLSGPCENNWFSWFMTCNRNGSLVPNLTSYSSSRDDDRKSVCNNSANVSVSGSYRRGTKQAGVTNSQ